MSFGPAWTKLAKPYIKNKSAGGIAQVVEQVRSWGSVPSTTKNSNGGMNTIEV
jgi:hypothetical protein